MKPITFSKFWILLILLIQLSCNKEINPAGAPEKSEPPVTLSNMLNCHGMTLWDSLATNNNLVGKWDWEYIQCYWNSEDGNNEDFKGLSVEFKPNNTLEVKENGQITQTATWQVADLHDGFFEIDVSPLVIQLPGRILFCDDRVIFNDSYTDGCDNYFHREN